MAGPLPPLQSSKARLTNPGIPLISEFRGGESDTVREIPPEWRAALDLHVTEQSIPFDQDLFELTDEILASKTERTVTSEKKIRTTRKPAGTFTLLEKFTNKDKEYGTRTRNFRFIDDFPAELAIPSATTDVSTRNFGNKHFEEIVEQIPGIFDAESFTVKRPVVTPEDFRALLQEHEHCVTEEGDAAEPTLIMGDISRTDTQQDLFLHRECREYIDLSSIPRTIQNRRTNKFKQVETVARWLLDQDDTPTPPTALRDTTFTKLGDGTALEERIFTDTLFDQHVFAREKPDVVPEWAKAQLPILEESFFETDIAVDPDPLPDGVYLERQQQEDVFNRRVTRRSRDPLDLPVQRVNLNTNRYKQVETITEILEDEGTTPAVPTALRDVVFEVLGDGSAVERRTVIPSLFTENLFERSIPDVTPEWAKALLQTQTQETNVTGTAADPTLVAGDLRRSEKQYDVFDKRTSRTFRDVGSLPKQRVGYRTNRYKQVETVTDILELDSTTPAVPTALRDVTFEKLGDGTAVEQRVDIAEVFDEHTYSREKPDLTPGWAKALLPVFEESLLEIGTASDPDPLDAGVYLKSEQQVNVFDRRVTTRSRDLVGLPVQRVGYRTNRYKQIETVTDILEDDSTTPATPTALRDVVFEVLGDGTATEQHVDVDEVFEGLSASTEILDLLPDIFKAALPITVQEYTDTGIVVQPLTLASGDLEHTETQTDVFNRRVKIRSRKDISLPQSLVGSRRIGGEQFGGEITQLTGYLDDSEPSVETGLDVVSSEVKNLGNGTWFRQTEKLDTAMAWPTLPGQYFDKEMQVNALTEEQTVDPSYSPTPDTYAVESLKPIDQYHAKRIKLTREPTAVSLETALIEEVDGPFQFPGIAYLAPSGLGYYRRQASAQLCQHIIRTWWMSSPTKPTRTLPGDGGDVEVQDIIMDDIIISTLNDITVLAYSGMCLHDAITTFGTFVYAATVPSATEYIALIGSEIVVGASIEPTDIPELWKIQTKSVVAR